MAGYHVGLKTPLFILHRFPGRFNYFRNKFILSRSFFPIRLRCRTAEQDTNPPMTPTQPATRGTSKAALIQANCLTSATERKRASRPINMIMVSVFTIICDHAKRCDNVKAYVLRCWAYCSSCKIFIKQNKYSEFPKSNWQPHVDTIWNALRFPMNLTLKPNFLQINSPKWYRFFYRSVTDVNGPIGGRGAGGRGIAN